MRIHASIFTSALVTGAHVTAVLLTAVLCAGHADAADKPKKEGSFGTGKSTGAYLTKDQLKACFAQQTRIKDQATDLTKEQAELGTMKADIARTGDTLKQQIDTVDRANAEAVAAYNEQAQARDKQIDDYQNRVTAFNTKVEAAGADRTSFSKQCENKRYFEDDEIAIKKGN